MDLLELVKEERRRREAGEPPLPVEPIPPSFAELTGQHWRLRTALVLELLGSLIMMTGWRGIDGPKGVELTMAGTLIALVGFVVICLAVWCPACHTAVVWHTFTTRHAFEAHDFAVYKTNCPKCGYAPHAQAQSSNNEAKRTEHG